MLLKNTFSVALQASMALTAAAMPASPASPASLSARAGTEGKDTEMSQQAAVKLWKPTRHSDWSDRLNDQMATNWKQIPEYDPLGNQLHDDEFPTQVGTTLERVIFRPAGSGGDSGGDVADSGGRRHRLAQLLSLKSSSKANKDAETAEDAEGVAVGKAKLHISRMVDNYFPAGGRLKSSMDNEAAVNAWLKGDKSLPGTFKIEATLEGVDESVVKELEEGSGDFYLEKATNPVHDRN